MEMETETEVVQADPSVAETTRPKREEGTGFIFPTRFDKREP